jgi:GTP-binding protein HflX
MSALTGEGSDEFLIAVEARIASGRPQLTLSLDPADGAGFGWLHRHAEVLDHGMDEEGRLSVTVRVDTDKLEQVRRKFPDASRSLA